MLKHRRIDGWMVSVGMGLACWVFFAVFYRHHLHYREQLQLFLFTPGYFFEQCSLPGGFAGYVGGFFTQLCYDSFLGALGLSFLLVVLQRFVSDATCCIANKPIYRFLTCIPSLSYGLILCNEDMMVAGLAALILSMAAGFVYNRIGRFTYRSSYCMLMIPILYWLAGVAMLTFLVYTLLREWLRKDKIEKKRIQCLTVSTILVCGFCPYIAKVFLPFYPIERLLTAGNYHRFVTDFPIILMLVFLLTAALPFVIAYLPDAISKTGRIIIAGIQLLFLLLIAIGAIGMVADWNKEEIMSYSYYARMQKWDSIIALADKKMPAGPLTVSTLNLALCQRNYLPEYMFTYFQNGPEGLIPDFNKDFNSLLMTGEIYYHLGLINTAQHYAFEAMEAIPDYQKSVRCIKRLAETGLINGEYPLAVKYLELLKHTLFYRKWAIEASTYVGNEDKINDHPEWGKLRQLRPYEDFFFSDGEKDMMLGLLYQQHPSNKSAYQYLLAYTLLVKDLKRFTNYFLMNRESLSEPVPRSYREAFAMIRSRPGYDPTQKPPFLHESIIKKLEAYRQIYTSNPAAERVLKEKYGDTYWYYFHFRR